MERLENVCVNEHAPEFLNLGYIVAYVGVSVRTDRYASVGVKSIDSKIKLTHLVAVILPGVKHIKITQYSTL